MVQSKSNCKSDDKLFGKMKTIEQCAEKCKNTQGCRYFVYGIGKNAEKCFWEKTSDATCVEGWEKDTYHFYALTEPYHCK